MRGLAQIGETRIRFVPLLWIIVLIVVILAVGGGLPVNGLVWLPLVVARSAFMSGLRV
jgi:hypothetical protein